MQKKRANFWIALAIPFIVIIMFLVKIYHTVESGSSDPFTLRGGSVFTLDQIKPELEYQLPLENGFDAVLFAAKNTDVLKRVESLSVPHKAIVRYGWNVIAVKDVKLEKWNVTFREKGIVPKRECKIVLYKSSQIFRGLDCREIGPSK